MIDTKNDVHVHQYDFSPFEGEPSKPCFFLLKIAKNIRVLIKFI